MRVRLLVLNPEYEHPTTGWTIPVQWGCLPITLRGRLQFEDGDGQWHDVQVEELDGPPAEIR